MKPSLINLIVSKGNFKSLSKAGGVGSTGEAHLATLNNKKYLLRICKDKETAKRYVKIYNRFKKYGFFPKLLGYKNKLLLFEFINGRGCHEKENSKVIYQIGRICGIINQSKADNDFQKSKRFFQKLNAIKKKKILSRNKIIKIKSLYFKLDRKIKLQGALDAGDVTNDNFIVRKGKVYFVDIEAVKENIKGYGIAKAFSSWFREEKERELFRKGYNSSNSMKFYNAEYHKFVTLIFLVNRINFKHDKGEKEIVKRSIIKLNKLLKERD